MTDDLQVRFDHLGRGGNADWGDVLRRAGKRNRRRRVTVAAGLAGIVALLTPTSLALRGSVVDFFASEPAPKHVVLDFARLDVGAPAGMETGVISEQARAVLSTRLDNGRRLTLWVAPTQKGGFCAFLGKGGGSHPPYSVPIEHGIFIRGPIATGGVIRGGPVLVSGSAQLPDADSIELRYRDGDSDTQRLTWVSSPIDAGFFVFEVGRAHWNMDRPKELIVLDANGSALRVEPVHFVLPPDTAPNGAPAEVILDQSRKLISVQTHTGTEAALWVGPTADGRACHWLRYGEGGFGGGCSEKHFLQPFGLGRSQGKDVVLLWGGPLRQDISDVEIRFEDGDRYDVSVVEDMVLYEIPPSHFPRGHRPYLLIARDAQGREVARQKMATKDVADYPCKKPVPIGAGEKACP
jgi:hypothetical protein